MWQRGLGRPGNEGATLMDFSRAYQCIPNNSLIASRGVWLGTDVTGTSQGLILGALIFNALSTNPIKWSNTLKQFVGDSRRIAWVCLTILLGWCLKC